MIRTWNEKKSIDVQSDFIIVEANSIYNFVKWVLNKAIECVCIVYVRGAMKLNFIQGKMNGRQTTVQQKNKTDGFH